MKSYNKYDIVNATNQLVHMLKESSTAAIGDAFEMIASTANRSKFAASLEPLQGILAALHSEVLKRALLNEQNQDQNEEVVEP